MRAGEGAARWRPSDAAVVVVTHPVVLLSLLVLVANDRVGKAQWPGPATGIASDVAGLILLPVIAAVLVDALSTRAVRWPMVAAIAVGVASAFAAVELLPVADGIYERGFGLFGWPVRSLIGGGGSTRVVATADPADLLALPFAVVGPLLWRRAERRVEDAVSAPARHLAVSA